jgi:hypothetical protein
MRFWVKSLAPSLLVAVLASPLLVTGCKTQDTTIDNEQRPSDYTQWERDTHRQHQDFNKRTPEEQKEYRDWQQNHNDH